MKIYPNLIVIDGLDGVGKTSTAIELGNALSKLGFDVVIKQFEKEYFQESFYEARKYNNANIKYFLQLASLSKLGEEIKAIPYDTTVICDRYIYSVNAYYSALPQQSRISNPVIPFSIPEPQLKVLLECNNETRKIRMSARDTQISKRKEMTLTNFGKTIHSNLLIYSPWMRINNENLTISDCSSQIATQYIEGKKV